MDLREFSAWCWQRDHRLFDVRRVDIECFARDLEDRGKARSTVARRVCTVVRFYRYAEDEGVIEHSPAVDIRRHVSTYASHVAHRDRNELGAILITAALSSVLCSPRSTVFLPPSTGMATSLRSLRHAEDDARLIEVVATPRRLRARGSRV